MFLNYAKPIEWNPEFYTTICDDIFIMMSESQQYALPYEDIEMALKCICSNDSVEKTIKNWPQLDIISVYQLLDNLYSKQLIQNTLNSNWFSIDTSLPATTYKHYSQFIYDFCALNCNDYLIFLRSLCEYFKINIILISDHLDPRLSTLNISNNTLIIKLSNKVHYIGPLLTNEDSDIERVRYCISQNQPLRTWLDNKKGKFSPIPYRFLKLNDEKKSSIKHAIASLLSSRNKNFILEIKNKGILKKHYFQNHSLRQQSNHALHDDYNKVILSSCMKNSLKGGYRHLTPQQTLDNCAHLISPFTGIISTINEVKSQHDLPFKSYSSSFFRSVPQNSNPLDCSMELTSLGKGVSDNQSKVSAICESLERYAAHYQKNDYIKIASYNSIEKEAIHPEILIGLSDAQKLNFEDIDYPAKRSSHGSIKFDANREISWHPAWSLSEQRQVYLPLCYALANSIQDIKFCTWNSNGCAAGNTTEEAILQGFLEVVERDAVAMWWYNKARRPQVALDLLPEYLIEVILKTLGKEWDYWVLDVTNDFEIPVFVAISKHKQSGTFKFGFGCHIAPAVAMERAITELTQLISISNQHSSPFDFDAIQDESYLYPEPTYPTKFINDYPKIEQLDIKDDIQYCLEKASAINLETIALPYDRPELPIKVVRVIIPNTSHIWPQFALSRLYKVPVKLGWLKQELTEKTLNKQMLYV